MTKRIVGYRAFQVGSEPPPLALPRLESLNNVPYVPGEPARCIARLCVAAAGTVRVYKSSALVKDVTDTENPDYFEEKRIGEDGPCPHRVLPEFADRVTSSLCGYHAVKRRGDALAMTGAYGLVAEVELYGLVQEHEEGWRGQYMDVLALFCPPGQSHHLRPLAQRYGCKIKEDPWISASTYVPSSYPPLHGVATPSYQTALNTALRYMSPPPPLPKCRSVNWFLLSAFILSLLAWAAWWTVVREALDLAMWTYAPQFAGGAVLGWLFGGKLTRMT